MSGGKSWFGGAQPVVASAVLGLMVGACGGGGSDEPSVGLHPRLGQGNAAEIRAEYQALGLALLPEDRGTLGAAAVGLNVAARQGSSSVAQGGAAAPEAAAAHDVSAGEESASSRAASDSDGMQAAPVPAAAAPAAALAVKAEAAVASLSSPAASTPAPSPSFAKPAVPLYRGETLYMADASASTAGAPQAEVTDRAAQAAIDAARYHLLAQRVVKAVNEARAQARTCGDVSYPAAPPLRWNPQVAYAALLESEWMLANNKFSHGWDDGKYVWHRFEMVHYAWSQADENIAAGFRTLPEAMQAWIDSPSHCKALMRADIQEVGLAVVPGTAQTQYGSYWTMALGTKR